MFTTPMLALVLITSAKTVAVPNVTGPKKAGPAEVQRAVQEALEEGGFTTIGEAALKRAEKKAGKKMDRLEAAQAAGAQLIAEVEIQKTGAKYYVTAELTDCGSGELVLSVRHPIGGGKTAEAAGAKLGAMLAKAAEQVESLPAGDGEAEEGGEELASSSSKRVVKPRASREERSAPPAGASPAIIPRDEDPTAVASASARVDTGRFYAQEDRPLRLTAAIGSRLATNYAVLTQGEVTGLGYGLSPQAMFAAEARVAPFDTPIALEVGLQYAALKYKLDIMPALTPNEPTGNYLDVRANLAYTIELTSWSGGALSASPLAGVHYQSLGVEKQMPFDVILSSSSVAPRGGVRFGLRLGDTVALEAEGVVRLIASYDETPATTGAGGKGFGLTTGARARWWASDNFGFYAATEYDYASIAMNGTATRTTFSGDPALQSAEIYQSQLTLGLGAVLAL